MLASGPALLTALALLQADAQFIAGARIESRAGEAPSFTSGNGTEFQVTIAAIPTLSLRMLDDISDFAANSTTRIFWRPYPQRFLDHRPLFLEAIDISHTLRTSRRSTWQYTLRTSYGEEDYVFLSTQFPNQPTLPTQLTILSLSGSATGTWKTSRRGALAFQLSAVHRRSTDSQPATTSRDTAVIFPPQTTVTASPGMRYQTTRRTLLEASSPVADTDIRGATALLGSGAVTPTGGSLVGQTTNLNILTVQPQLAIAHDLTRYQRVRLMAGLTYAATLVGQNVSPLSPLFQIDLNSLLDRSRGGPTWQSTLSAGTMWYADPVLGAAVSRGFLQARLESVFSRAWSASARLSFATDLTNLQKKLPVQPPAANGTPVQAGIPLDETLLSLDLPIRYRESNRFFAEFGGSFVERGPYLDSHFGWRRGSRELWLFLNLSAISTAPRASMAPAPRS